MRRKLVELRDRIRLSLVVWLMPLTNIHISGNRYVRNGMVDYFSITLIVADTCKVDRLSREHMVILLARLRYHEMLMNWKNRSVNREKKLDFFSRFTWTMSAKGAGGGGGEGVIGTSGSVSPRGSMMGCCSVALFWARL